MTATCGHVRLEFGCAGCIARAEEARWAAAPWRTVVIGWQDTQDCEQARTTHRIRVPDGVDTDALDLRVNLDDTDLWVEANNQDPTLSIHTWPVVVAIKDEPAAQVAPDPNQLDMFGGDQ